MLLMKTEPKIINITKEYIAKISSSTTTAHRCSSSILRHSSIFNPSRNLNLQVYNQILHLKKGFKETTVFTLLEVCAYINKLGNSFTRMIILLTLHRGHRENSSPPP